MLGKITKIDTLKLSRNKGTAFKRVYFKLKLAPGKFINVKTDLVPTFRNYANWKKLLVEGNVLGGLVLKADNTIDADSHPKYVGRIEVTFAEKEVNPQLSLL